MLRACYCCKQAAEKAIKAWLTCHDITFPKTHDLEAQLDLPRGNRASVHTQKMLAHCRPWPLNFGTPVISTRWNRNTRGKFLGKPQK
jgi:hypothetical protein